MRRKLKAIHCTRLRLFNKCIPRIEGMANKLSTSYVDIRLGIVLTRVLFLQIRGLMTYQGVNCTILCFYLQ